MVTVQKSIDIKVPVSTAFTYFARPEHVSDQMTGKGIAMTVIPIDIKDGMGVGTTFRIIGDFNGKRLEWDCITTEFKKEEKISAKMIKGKFKKWEITTQFKLLNENLTNILITVDYEMPLGIVGKLIDKFTFRKSVLNGIETALYKVRGLLEGNGSIPVYITLSAYKKLISEKKKMNNVSVSTALSNILEKYNSIATQIKN